MRRIHFAGATRSVKPCHCRLRLQNSFPDKEIGVLLLTIFVRLSISIQTLRMREFFHRNDLIHEIVLLVPNGPMARDAPNSQHPNKWRLIAIPYSKQSYQSRWWPAFWFLGFAWHPGIWGSHFPREHLQRWTTNKNNKRRRKRSGRNIDRNQNKKDGNPKRNYMMRDVILTIYIYKWYETPTLTCRFHWGPPTPSPGLMLRTIRGVRVRELPASIPLGLMAKCQRFLHKKIVCRERT